MEFGRFKQRVISRHGYKVADEWARYVEANPGCSYFVALREAREIVSPYLESIGKLENARFNSYGTFNPLDSSLLEQEPRLR
jgi:hypothetical protein